MNEFDEERWDQQNAEYRDEFGLTHGWLIQKVQPGQRTALVDSQPIYLQIATGQWCTPKYATLFPTKSAALIYAVELGHAVVPAIPVGDCCEVKLFR